MIIIISVANLLLSHLFCKTKILLWWLSIPRLRPACSKRTKRRTLVCSRYTNLVNCAQKKTTVQFLHSQISFVFRGTFWGKKKEKRERRCRLLLINPEALAFIFRWPFTIYAGCLRLRSAADIHADSQRCGCVF